MELKEILQKKEKQKQITFVLPTESKKAFFFNPPGLSVCLLFVAKRKRNVFL
jgi:hypothetical protein